MKEQKIYYPNSFLINYLIKNNFIEIPSNSGKRYFTHNENKLQIRINLKKEIALIDNKGNLISKSNCLLKKDLINKLKKD